MAVSDHGRWFAGQRPGRAPETTCRPFGADPRFGGVSDPRWLSGYRRRIRVPVLRHLVDHSVCHHSVCHHGVCHHGVCHHGVCHHCFCHHSFCHHSPHRSAVRWVSRHRAVGS